VVPFKYKFNYLDEIDEKKYFEAMSYFLSIGIGQFKKLEKENNVELDKNTYFVNAFYDKRLGLKLNTEDDDVII
jgi:CRISPR-associated endonuclease/helicase Cas3